MPPPLEIHVPISPTSNFFNRVHYLAASLRDAGGLAAESSLIVTVGEDQDPVDLAAALPWSRRYPITWRWLNRDRYRRFTYYATALDRFTYEFTAPLGLLLDADVLVAKDFGDLAGKVQREKAFSGSMAHLCPFTEVHCNHVPPEPPIPLRTQEDWWKVIFDRAAIARPPFDYEYKGWNNPRLLQRVHPAPIGPFRYSPPYFNLGVLLAPVDIFSSIGRTIYQDMGVVDEIVRTPFRLQIALTLSLLRTGRPYFEMPLRYNFPNFVEVAEANPEELNDVRIIHYINQDFFNKSKTLESTDTIGTWLATNNGLPSIEQVLRDRIADLHSRVLGDLEGP